MNQKFAWLLSAVSGVTDIPEAEILSQRRAQGLVRARMIVAHVAHEYLGYSYPEIGRALGGRDHTTILHNGRQAAIALTTEQKFADDLADVLRLCGLSEADRRRAA